MNSDFLNEREEVAYFMRRLYRKNLTTCSGGNISYRINDDIILVTPTKLDKARLKANQIVIMKIDGTNLTPELKPTSETPIHLSVFKKKDLT